MESGAEEATSVVAWFDFYTRLYEDDARVARPSRTLLQLLQAAFPVLYEDVVSRKLMLGADEWECVVALLGAFYEVELGIDRSALNDAMTFEAASVHASCVDILEYVVSALVQSDDKTRFVRDIMTMDDSVQVDIMAVIERAMNKTSSLVKADCEQRSQRSDSRDNSRGDRVESPIRPAFRQSSASPTSSSASSRSPLHLARNAEMERLQRANDILREDNIHVSQELADIKSKYELAAAENAALLQTIQSTKLQAEMDLLKKERTVRSYFDERVHSLQRELERTASELEEKVVIAKEVTELRDEVDLLRSSAERLAKAESMLSKYKTKIEELSSVNEKLRRTEEANSELVEKNLALESQATKAASLQRKLADSKEANTSIQFHVSELESKLARVVTELDAKRLECDSSAAALAEAKIFNQQLQQTVDQQMEAKGSYTAASSGSAGGISELNPELMEKLARLEHENATLRSQVDGTTSERIDSLLDEIDDLNRLKKSFESKYFETSELLKQSQDHLKATEESLAALRSDLTVRHHELQAMTNDRNLVRMNLDDAEKRIAELIEVIRVRDGEIQVRVDVEGSLKTETARLKTEMTSLQLSLGQTIEDLRMSSEHNYHLLEDVIAHTAERLELLATRDELTRDILMLQEDRATRMARIDDLESECAGLRDQLQAAGDCISSLRLSESCHAMRCEDLYGVLLMKTEIIESQMNENTVLSQEVIALKLAITDLEDSRRNAEMSIHQLTEQLNMTEEDLKRAQEKRSELMSTVDSQVEQILNSRQKLQESHETLKKVGEDYEHRLRSASVQKSAELSQLTSAFEERLKEAAEARHELISAYEDKLDASAHDKTDTITRMTSVIDEKCALLQQMKNEMTNLRVEHERTLSEERDRFTCEKGSLEVEKIALAAEFNAYISSHGYSNDDVNSKEDSLQERLAQLSASFAEEKSKLTLQRDSVNDQVKRLQDANRDMKVRFEGQELKLREAVKMQLEANRRLVEVNQAVKSELAKKDAQVIQLENAVTRLDSRILLFERERAHYSSEEGKRRDTDDTSTSYSTHLSTNFAQVMREFEALRKENRAFQEQLARRPSDQDNGDDGNGQRSTKSYLMERIRALEVAKAQEEDKKRELLLVNAKLIQDRKQIQVRNASDTKEVQLLKEKVNTWMLRDERRKKEHEAFARRAQDLESENKTLREKLKLDSGYQSSQDYPSQSSQECLEPILPLKSASSDDQENIPPVDKPQSPVGSQKKRKIEDTVDTNEPSPVDDQLSQHGELSIEKAHNVPQDVKPSDASAALTPTAPAPPADAPRVKRRMSHFIFNRLAAAGTTALQEDEKPSECQQQ